MDGTTAGTNESRPSVLIVDDEYQICTGIAGILGHLGYRADFVHHQSGAGVFLDEHKDVDIVLLDINLGPGPSGIDLLPVIRGKSRYAQVIMFTSEDKLEVGVECLKRGAYDYMTKPFDEKTFVNKAAGALERKKNLQLNDLYLGILFHDLKSPLQTLISGVDLLRMSLAHAVDPAVYKTSFHAMDHATGQILMMINNIVSVSKFENGVYAIRRESFILRKQAEKTLSLFNPSPARPDTAPCSLRFLTDDDFTLITDKELFCRVLVNIAGNALRYAAGKSQVRVEFVEEDGGYLRTSVTNTGSFIEESAREVIFNKFSSVERPVGNGGFQNYGLGLTFSKMAVEAMAGRIWITCDKAVPSTTFNFTVKNFGS
ncbi:MAG: hybrid sensor histidine kinase/response regulator [Chitinispirillaceae bacterium]|nr:hybrid sensor histidine kinase/response regulator [Chitinispirillaceae bacterium]